MSGMAHAMMQPVVWTPSYAALMFAMWWVMMAAMMLPSAAPMLLLFPAHPPGRARWRTLLCTDRYFRCRLSCYMGGFSALATLAQWGLQQIDLLSPMMATSSRLLAATILIGAEAWQLTPIKRICLQHCRSPGLSCHKLATR